MPDLNKIYLIGNLTRDPELRSLPSGSALCRLGLAVNRRYSTARGEEREEVCFVDVEAWGRQGETAERFLRKGSPILVEGRLKYDQWEDRTTGQKRSRLLVHADRIQFLGRPAAGTEYAGDSTAHRNEAGASPGLAAGRQEPAPMPPFENPGGGEAPPPAEDDVPF